MNYAEHLAEFQSVTGHKPGEMNKRPSIEDAINQLAAQIGEYGGKPDRIFIDGEEVSLEPPAQSAGPLDDLCSYCETLRTTGHDSGRCACPHPSDRSAGPGRCNRFTRVGALGDPSPCKLPVNHEGPHEP